MKKTIAEFMTPSPVTIGVDQTVAFANRRMHEAGIRHLPVLEAGKLVGILSDRDIALIEGLPGADIETLMVGDAMSSEVYAVSSKTTLAHAAEIMAERKIGSAVVTEHGKVVGIFTTVDALRVLAEHLRTPRKAA